MEASNGTARSRRLRSFVRRGGRITPAQERALTELFPVYGLSLDAVSRLPELLGRRRRVSLEIGCGNGENLIAAAAREASTWFLACEVHRPGLGHALNACDRIGLNNVRVIEADVVDVLQSLPSCVLDSVEVYFPDPWPKKRHHKRRLVNEHFMQLVRNALKPTGVFRFATDDSDYADCIMELIDGLACWVNIAGRRCFSPRPRSRILTRFEGRAGALGSKVYELTAMPKWAPAA